MEFDGGVKILVDVGWDESFSTELLKELEKYEHGFLVLHRQYPTEQRTDWMMVFADMSRRYL